MSTFLFNFKKEFVPAVESGQKCQTIRCKRKDGKRPVIGDTVKLYTGLRSRNTRLLRATPVTECLSVRMHLDDGVIVIDGRKLDIDEATEFAKADGFNSVGEMEQWFIDQYKTYDFEGFCIRWSAL